VVGILDAWHECWSCSTRKAHRDARAPLNFQRSAEISALLRSAPCGSGVPERAHMMSDVRSSFGRATCLGWTTKRMQDERSSLTNWVAEAVFNEASSRGPSVSDDQREQRRRRVGCIGDAIPQNARSGLEGASGRRLSRAAVTFPVNAGVVRRLWVRWVCGAFDESGPETAAVRRRWSLRGVVSPERQAGVRDSTA
jgi:hypothetical protein